MVSFEYVSELIDPWFWPRGVAVRRFYEKQEIKQQNFQGTQTKAQVR